MAVTIPITSYVGVPREEVTPVFRTACYLRFRKPDVDMLLQHVDTWLDHTVVSALIEAALRLLPPANTPEGKIEAAQRMQKKAKEAETAEASFVDRVRSFGHHILTESEQKKLQLRPTPNIRFSEPIMIDGCLCYWLEYKNFFGFRSNPFIASKTIKQLKKYASCLGPGAVVYKLGFKTGHIVDTRIHLFREAEALRFLERTAIDSTLGSGFR
ncbi:hypothetical protein BO85DRAFT_489905 [Aspergillus piperis CBS 112811]|uniref:CDAN1-interacting nuclease 1 n=1 Tax=Aspergillus piperis CBS 112811 TaxID=1448313 RepID=A0A8G1R2X8_9EURO|nr:hypothetical protein BO85DRAFT_489905 [Aspergillus piperis CBS 112811]RAH55915.1 hypothetical protein BO85DRAFT_489905 [Aspergillus piperis CBS 112811]